MQDLLFPVPYCAASARAQVVSQNANFVIWNPNNWKRNWGTVCTSCTCKGKFFVFLSDPLLGKVCVRISQVPRLWIHSLIH